MLILYELFYALSACGLASFLFLFKLFGVFFFTVCVLALISSALDYAGVPSVRRFRRREQRRLRHRAHANAA